MEAPGPGQVEHARQKVREAGREEPEPDEEAREARAQPGPDDPQKGRPRARKRPVQDPLKREERRRKAWPAGRKLAHQDEDQPCGGLGRAALATRALAEHTHTATRNQPRQSRAAERRPAAEPTTTQKGVAGVIIAIVTGIRPPSIRQWFDECRCPS